MLQICFYFITGLCLKRTHKSDKTMEGNTVKTEWKENVELPDTDENQIPQRKLDNCSILELEHSDQSKTYNSARSLDSENRKSNSKKHTGFNNWCTNLQSTHL